MVPISLMASWACWNSALTIIDLQFETTGTWPRVVVALMAAVTCESVLVLYVDHRRTKAVIIHWVPITLRLSLIVLLAFVLLEPVVSHEEEAFSQRHVAVLVDASASMDLNDHLSPDQTDSKISRRDFSRQLLLEGTSVSRPFLDRLETDYNVRLFEFAGTPREVSTTKYRNEQNPDKRRTKTENPRFSDWAANTDMAAAIRRVDDQLPLDELSGLILLTDGCDHSDSELQDSIGRLVHRKIPIHTVIIGDQTPIRDAEVTTVQVPKQVFLGDSVSIRAAIKVDGYPSQTVQVRLIKDKETIDEKTITVHSNRHRETVVFRHRPDQVGVHQYIVEVDPLSGERVKENNRSAARVAISEDSIRMLIVESRPRWEFRYLRNLFAGRDRTVHLQYVLLHPDRLAGVPDPPTMHASVNRTFDDCEATALPVNEEEWLKFDVIVLGDVAPDDLGENVMLTLGKFVAARSGTLIVLSGRQHMPHAFAQTPLADVLPVQLDGSPSGDATSPDSEYRFRVASGAESHVIMQQATDPEKNEAVWNALPRLHWRHPTSKAKAGATVLAYAEENRDSVSSQQEQRDRALILWHRFGGGRVMQLAFDQTWRLRYGIGDQHHHQFWGQVLRWSIQDRLSAGTQWVRMGTDRALYRIGDSVNVRARLLDKNRSAVVSEDTQVFVYLDDELIQKTPLKMQPDSGGMLMGKIDGLDREGAYRIELVGPTVDRLLQREGRSDEPVSIDFALEGSSSRSEMSDRVADTTVPAQLAAWTGGIVVNPAETDRVLDRLGPKSTFRRNQWTVPLWNRWPLILAFLLLVGVEWVFRKSTGLI